MYIAIAALRYSRQKSRTPTAEIKQKSESEIRNQFANLCARQYTAKKPPRTSVFLFRLQHNSEKLPLKLEIT